MIELCPKCGAEEITDGVWRCNSYSSIMGFAEQGEHCKDRATLTARESELAEANERLRVTAGALVKMESELAEAKAELQDAYDVCAKLDADCREAKRQREHYYKACVSHEAKIAEAAATALGYPRYCDMEPINPHDPADVESQSKDTNRFYGDHVSDTLVDELCRRYAEANRLVAELEAIVRITHIPGKEDDDGEMH